MENVKIEHTEESRLNTLNTLKTLVNDAVYCDVQLITDDSNIVIHSHKLVLASVSHYFHSIFQTNPQDEIFKISFSAITLKLIFDFIYGREVFITENNVKDLLIAANIVQIKEIHKACCDFLHNQLQVSNCLNMNELAGSHEYVKLLKSSELCIEQHFSLFLYFCIGNTNSNVTNTTEWYNPKIKKWEFGIAMDIEHPKYFFNVLELSTEAPCWTSHKTAMKVKRNYFGLGVVHNLLYAVGGHDGTTYLDSVEVFDVRTGEWRLVCKMKMCCWGRSHE
ncbi:kelch-like protein 3 [Acyrthosiphon pisum]|uniref:BTB domain-containing protein n=1 Tax=Acyrthosiphon pisum TaxID=7029 RepID=A0A8R2B6W0_ACYPI|nr:kelch-like protein 3 [Acyrthosiphon pisum]|eukprot:XP_008184129.1 PREDICTED: kelch-like protein 3 [Acyrthosiphon pisum]